MSLLQTLRARKPSARLTILLLSLISLILSIVQVSACTFMSGPGEIEGRQQMELGLFSRAVYDLDGDTLGCIDHLDADIDFMLQVGRALGVLTVIFGGLAVACIGCTLFFKPKRSALLWSLARVLPVCGTLSQIFTFMVLGTGQCSGEGCTLSGAGAGAVVNVFVLSALSVITNLVSPPTIPWYVWWNEHHLIGSKSTLVGSQETGGGLTGTPMITAIDMLEMEDINLRNGELPAPSLGDNSHNTIQTAQDSSTTSSVAFRHQKKIRLTTFALIVTAWIISIVGVNRCTFLLVGPINGSKADYSGLGLYSRASYDGSDVAGCLSYPDSAKDDFDTSFETARVFGAITAFLTTTAVVLGIMQLFAYTGTEEAWYISRAVLPAATVTQLLVFLVYRTELCTASPDFVECIPGGAGITVILNIFLMVALCVYTIATPALSYPVFTAYQVEAKTGSSVASSLMVASGDMIESPRKQAPLPPLHEEFTMSSDNTESDSEEEPEPREKIVRIDPVPQHFEEEEPETITVSVVFTDEEKKTTKTITHPDGSKTVTTTIEELLIDENETKEEEISDESTHLGADEADGDVDNPDDSFMVGVEDQVKENLTVKDIVKRFEQAKKEEIPGKKVETADELD